MSIVTHTHTHTHTVEVRGHLALVVWRRALFWLAAVGDDAVCLGHSLGLIWLPGPQIAARPGVLGILVGLLLLEERLGAESGSAYAVDCRSLLTHLQVE